MTIQSCSESHLNHLIKLKKNTILWEELIVHRVEGNSKDLVVKSNCIAEHRQTPILCT